MTRTMNKTRAALTACLIAMLAGPAHAASGWGLLNMPEGVTELSKKIYDLHMMIFWWCVAIGIFVFGWMIWAIVAFRKSKGAVANTAMVHSTRAEIIWTLIPVVILVAMSVPSARVLIDIEDARNTELTVKVTAYQWKWQYQYLGTDVGYFSTLARDSNSARQLQSGVDPETVPNYLLDVDRPLVVPAGTKVRLLLTAQDVIHAWWVPDFGMKKDAIPGLVNEMWFKVDTSKTGRYRGQCAELCGRDHGFMPVVVVVKPQAEFDAWLAAQQAARQAAKAPATQTAATVPTVDNVAAVRLADAE